MMPCVATRIGIGYPARGMRKAALALGLMIAAGAGGLALAGAGLGPSIAILAGLLILAGVVTFFDVSTGDLAFWAVALLLFTVTWNGIRVGGGGFGNVFMAIAFAAVITHVVVEKRPLPLPPWLFIAGLGFLLAGLLSMVFPPNPQVAQQSILTQLTVASQINIQSAAQVPSNELELAKYELSVILIPILIATVGTTVGRCRRLINLFVAGALVNAAAGVLDHVGIHLGPVPYSNARSAGLTVQSNYLALTCAIAIPMAMLWFGRSRRWTLAGAVAVPLLLGGVYASGSRAGFVSGLLAVVLPILLVPRLRPAISAVLPFLGMALVLVFTFTHVGSKILQQVRLGGSSTTTAVSDYRRSTAASVAWSQIQARPVEGVGFSVIAYAHDIYLELLDAGGMIAMLAFAVFLAGVMNSAVKSRAGPLREEAIVCGVAVAVWLINGIFDNQVADKYLYVVPGLLLAIARTTWLCGPQHAVPRSETAPRAALAHPQTLAGVGAP